MSQHRLITAALIVLSLSLAFITPSMGTSTRAAPILGGTYWRDDFSDATSLAGQQDVTVSAGQVILATGPFTWTQTTRDDFNAGDLMNLDVDSSPGNLLLAEEGLRVNRVLSADAAARQSAPAIAAAPDGTLYATWEDLRDGQWNIYLTKSTDGGTTWSPNRAIRPAESSTSRRAPAIAAATGGMGVRRVGRGRAGHVGWWTSCSPVAPTGELPGACRSGPHSMSVPRSNGRLLWPSTVGELSTWRGWTPEPATRMLT